MKYIVIAIMIIATSFDIESAGKPKPQIKVQTVEIACSGDCPSEEV